MPRGAPSLIWGNKEYVGPHEIVVGHKGWVGRVYTISVILIDENLFYFCSAADVFCPCSKDISQGITGV